MKACRKCGELKEVSEFSRRKQEKDGINTLCNECNRAAAKAWRASLSKGDRNRKMLTVSKAAKKAGVSRSSVYRDIKKGFIEVVGPPRRARVDSNAVVAFYRDGALPGNEERHSVVEKLPEQRDLAPLGALDKAVVIRLCEVEWKLTVMTERMDGITRRLAQLENKGASKKAKPWWRRSLKLA